MDSTFLDGIAHLASTAAIRIDASGSASYYAAAPAPAFQYEIAPEALSKDRCLDVVIAEVSVPCCVPPSILGEAINPELWSDFSLLKTTILSKRPNECGGWSGSIWEESSYNITIKGRPVSLGKYAQTMIVEYCYSPVRSRVDFAMGKITDRNHGGLVEDTGFMMVTPGELFPSIFTVRKALRYADAPELIWPRLPCNLLTLSLRMTLYYLAFSYCSRVMAKVVREMPTGSAEQELFSRYMSRRIGTGNLE